MTHHPPTSWLGVATIRAVCLVLAVGVRLAGQDASHVLQLADRGERTPAFFSIPSPGAAPVDARNASVLRRRVSLAAVDVALTDALMVIERQAAVDIAYDPAALPANHRVSLRAEDITVVAALTELLLDTGLDVQVSAGDHITLVARPASTQVRVGVLHQQRTGGIAGRVTDVKTGQPLVAATVRVETTNARAVTGADGRYAIGGVRAGTYKVTASFLGYAPRTILVDLLVDSTAHQDFALSPTVQLLDAVVTTVTGNQQLRALGNTIGTISVADSVVGRAPVTDLSDVISARVPGVQVFENGGLTGASPEINIRGQNSAQLSNQPLLYIDGVRVDNSAAVVANSSILNFGATAGRFDDLSPAEIASIEIVKGPSAATLYGTDAANGVILVKTKHGAPGRRHWAMYAEQGLSTFDRNRFPDSYYPWGHTTDVTHAITQCTLQAVGAGICVQDSVTHFSPLKDPATTPIGTGTQSSYGLQLSGGADTRYFTSAAYQNEVGYLKMPTADRAILTAADGTPLGDDQLNPNAVRKVSLRQNLVTLLGSTADLSLSAGLLSQQSRIPSSISLTYGEFGPGYRDANDGWFAGFRPGWLFAERHAEDVLHVTGGGTSTWSPLIWLTTHATTGLDFSSTYFDGLARPGQPVFGNGLGDRLNTRTNSTLASVDVGATAAARLTTQLTARTSAGVQYNRNMILVTSAEAQQLNPGSQTLAGGAIQLNSESTTETVVAGGYAQEELSLENRLFLTGAIRADGGSAFGTGFKTATYPKLSLSWLLSDEPFWPHSSALSSLRLRAAYGASGVQPPPTAALATEQLFPAFVDGSATTADRLATTGNPTLKPEQQREFEGGADLDLAAGRIHVELTGYHKESRDALVQINPPTSLGAIQGQTINVGAVRNIGYEVVGTATIIDSRALSWNAGINASVNHNKLLTLGPGAPELLFAYGIASIVPGYPLFSNFEYPILGYSDANHDGIIETNEVTVGTSSAYVGPSYPTSQLTATSGLSVVGDRLHFAVQVDHRDGFTLLNRIAVDQCLSGYCRAVSVRSTSLAEQAAVASALQNPFTNLAGFYSDGSFTRLRELSATYTFPSAWSRQLRARSISVTLAGRNLALWTRYSGTDPEVSTSVGVTLSGAYTDAGGVPLAQYWVMRVNAGL